MTPFELKDRLNSTLAAKGQVVVISVNELRDLIDQWERDIRRRQDAENAAPSAFVLPASSAFA